MCVLLSTIYITIMYICIENYMNYNIEIYIYNIYIHIYWI